MGGYAIYVWPSFILSFIVLLANVWWSKAQLQRVMRDTAKKTAARAAKGSSASAARLSESNPTGKAFTETETVKKS